MITKDKKNKNKSKHRIDRLMLNEIELGIRQLKQSIVDKYIEEMSTLNMIVLVAIFGGLGFMFMKVNKLVNKAHLF